MADSADDQPGLLSLFAVQHSLMARHGFKRLVTRGIPAAAKRSTYVLVSSLALLLLFWQWRPLGGLICDAQQEVGRAVLQAGFAFGWILVLVTTFVINHFDLFGLRQTWRAFRGSRRQGCRTDTAWRRADCSSPKRLQAQDAGRPLRRYYRRIVVRYERHVENFLGMLDLACCLILLRCL